MFKIKALVTMLVLGTSAAAFAAPAPEFTAPVVVEHQAMPAPANWQHHWITLASTAKINGTREYVRVGAQAGRFDKLKLEQLSGKTEIKLVQINFADGQRQLAHVNTTLDRENSVATIALDGHHSIASITVYGAGNAHSSYSILAA